MKNVERPFWVKKIEAAWREAPIAWLCGVRRAGKTTLAKSFPEDKIHYVNCDLPIVEERVRDPELFYRSIEKPILIFDEIHQLRDPSRLLKIAADSFPNLKILATGSSTLAASKKFRDTLSGRKRMIHLVPVLWSELSAFSGAPLTKRLFHGGLPAALLADSKKSDFYREWMDSFFARDIQRLFAVRDMNKFNLLFEYVLRQSGGQVEVSKIASLLGISRITVESYLRALEITQAIHRVRPFHGGGQKELVKMPKVYAFDTGFVGFVRGWDPLRPEDYGVLWEHLVLEHLQAHLLSQEIHYWRDLEGREIDFILVRNRDQIDAIECKWNPSDFDGSALKIFRSYYPQGKNYVLSPLTGKGFLRREGSLQVRVCNPDELVA